MQKLDESATDWRGDVVEHIHAWYEHDNELRSNAQWHGKNEERKSRERGRERRFTQHKNAAVEELCCDKES